MISFFKGNDVFRFGASIIIFLVFRILLLVYARTESEQPLLWLALGERLTESSGLYSQIWTGIAPLSALFYYLVVRFFGESQLALEVIGTGVCFFEIIYLNVVLENRRVYKTKNQYVPFAFAIVANLHPSFAIASPAVLGSCFLFPLLNHLFGLNERSREDTFISVGVYISIAIFFDYAFIVFALLILIAFIYTGSAGVRGSIFTFLGASVVWFAFLLYFLFKGSLGQMIYQFVFYNFIVDKIFYSDINSVAALSGAMLFYVFWGYLASVSSRQFLNYQQTCQFLMLIWAVCAVFFHWLSADLSVNQSFLILPAVVFFVANQLTIFKRRWKVEVFGWFFLIMMFFVGLSNVSLFGKNYQLCHYATAENLLQTQKKSVLVLSRKFGGIKDNRIATKYFDWNLTQSVWLHLDSYEKILELERSVWADLPDMVFDPDGVAQIAFQKIPSLAREFERVSPTVWQRKK